jgi:formylglycine-generating enzyme required for sulfatase activity
MKKTFQTAVFTLFAASTVQAQEAVQWKVSDGGNGHWYQLTHSPAISWSAAAASASARGGQLATLTSSQENAFVVAELQGNPSRYPWIGLRQAPDAAEPGGGWAWVSSEPLSWTNWSSSEPNGDGAFDADQANIWLVDEPGLGRPLGTWNDWHTGGPDGYMVEWSADCNSDGIVDYGQCRDGSLPDYNGNNIPDCCETGEACVAGNYPVQWKVSEGGNGHWYRFAPSGVSPPMFDAQDELCRSQGGYMATITSSLEWDFFKSTAPTGGGYWIGLRSNACSDWNWADGESLGFAAWGGVSCGAGPYPNNCNARNLRAAAGDRFDCGWNWDDYPQGLMSFTAYCIEWSADCNNDGIVDYGQILQGQLVDGDQNGVPDVCEVDPCPADITGNGLVNGADLGLMLAAWGSDGSEQPGADINADGIVNGADLAFVIGAFGPCPTVPSWATLIEAQPDPAVVWDADLRAAITATGLAWRVKDTATQIEMLLIPSGSFEMGCSASELFPCYNNEYPRHPVSLTNAFYMGRYEVTQAQWHASMGSNPSYFQSASEQVPSAQIPNRPVERVSWNMIAGAGGFMAQTGMRLPTEAEWEFAYRAGTSTAFHGFTGHPNGTNDDSLVGHIAWWGASFGGNSNGQTHPVGGKAGNGFGLHDMAGNVDEWVNDWLGNYSTEAATDPAGPESGNYRVLRAGSWHSPSRLLRASYRYSTGAPGSGYTTVGCRVARDP